MLISILSQIVVRVYLDMLISNLSQIVVRVYLDMLEYMVATLKLLQNSRLLPLSQKKDVIGLVKLIKEGTDIYDTELGPFNLSFNILPQF